MNYAIVLRTVYLTVSAASGLQGCLSSYAGFVQPKFCEEVFPMLVHDVLVHGGAEHRQLLSLKLTEFFTTVCSDLPSPGRATTPLSSKLTISQQFSGVFVSFKPVHAVLMVELTLPGCVESGLKKQSMETMLRVVQHLRLQQRPSSGYNVIFLNCTCTCNRLSILFL